MGKALKLLVVEDIEADFLFIRSFLHRQLPVASCCRAATAEELASALDEEDWDVAIADYRLADLEFHQCFDLIRHRRPGLPVILVSGSLGEEDAVEWLKRGVADFVVKDRLARLVPAIQRAVREAEELRARRAAEEALVHSRGLLRLITDAAPALISYVDGDFRYRLVNRCYERWFGDPPEKLVGKEVREVLGESAWEQVRPYMVRALAGEMVVYEKELPYRGAGSRWVEVSYTPDLDEVGSVRGFVVLVQDIHERKRAELALADHKAYLEEEVAARTAELKATNRELQAFAYAVSHDLKAPLRSISAFSGLLEQRNKDHLSGESLEFLFYIRQGVSRMNSLIDDLLNYARMEQRVLRIRPLALLEVAEAAVSEKREEIERQGAEVRVDVPDIAVKADPDGLAQVLRNLLDNALKFSTQATPPLIEIGARETNVGCEVWVRDNGIGFSMSQEERIFEIFQRLHSIEDFPGTGIGLALVRKAMERMGGRVWAESTPGQGATFFLALPGKE